MSLPPGQEQLTQPSDEDRRYAEQLIAGTQALLDSSYAPEHFGRHLPTLMSITAGLHYPSVSQDDIVDLGDSQRGDEQTPLVTISPNAVRYIGDSLCSFTDMQRRRIADALSGLGATAEVIELDTTQFRQYLLDDNSERALLGGTDIAWVASRSARFTYDPEIPGRPLALPARVYGRPIMAALRAPSIEASMLPSTILHEEAHVWQRWMFPILLGSHVTREQLRFEDELRASHIGAHAAAVAMKVTGAEPSPFDKLQLALEYTRARHNVLDERPYAYSLELQAERDYRVTIDWYNDRLNYNWEEIADRLQPLHDTVLDVPA